MELYKEYAKKLIDEELAGKQEENTSDNSLAFKEEKPDKEISIPVQKAPSELLEEPKKDNSLRSIIRKKDQMSISTQKVSFHLGEMNEGTKEAQENEKVNEGELRVSHGNNLTPHMENKIRNSIKVLENDIKTLEISQVNIKRNSLIVFLQEKIGCLC